MKNSLIVLLVACLSVFVFVGCRGEGDYERENYLHYNEYGSSAPIRVDIENQSSYVCGVFKGGAQYALYNPGDMIPLYDDEVFDGENITITVWWMQGDGNQLVKVNEQSVVVNNSYETYKLVISNGGLRLFY